MLDHELATDVEVSAESLRRLNAELAAEIKRLTRELALAKSNASLTAVQHGNEISATRADLLLATSSNEELRAANAELAADRDDARAGEHRLAMILDSAVDHAIITTDLNGVITGWNPGARNITGWEADEVLGRFGHIIFTPEDRTEGAPEQEMSEALREGIAVDERWHLKKDGSRFWASGLMMQLRNGKLEGFLKIIRDRTGQRAAEEALRHQSELTAAIAVNAADSMILMDQQGRVTFSNPATEEIFGWTASELLGQVLLMYCITIALMAGSIRLASVL